MAVDGTAENSDCTLPPHRSSSCEYAAGGSVERSRPLYHGSGALPAIRIRANLDLVINNVAVFLARPEWAFGRNRRRLISEVTG